MIWLLLTSTLITISPAFEKEIVETFFYEHSLSSGVRVSINGKTVLSMQIVITKMRNTCNLNCF